MKNMFKKIIKNKLFILIGILLSLILLLVGIPYIKDKLSPTVNPPMEINQPYQKMR